jgi:hypothetical protein
MSDHTDTSTEQDDPLEGLSLTHRLMLGDERAPVKEIQLPEMATPVTIVGEIPDHLSHFFG